MTVVAALLVMAAASTAAEAANVPALPPRVHNLTLARADGPAVNYAISIPRNYSRGTPTPLVLALHFGTGGGAADGAGDSVLRILVGPGLAELGAIIVAPDSVGGGWNNAENEKAVTALLDAVLANYTVDQRKIAVTGYSMGGTGSWHFAQKFPDRFSAAIPLASRPPESATGWRVPVLAIHSRDDERAPFAPAQARITELQRTGVNAKLILLSGISHYETQRFQEPLRAAVPWLREVWK
jgi:predicted peptidase